MAYIIFVLYLTSWNFRDVIIIYVEISLKKILNKTLKIPNLNPILMQWFRITSECVETFVFYAVIRRFRITFARLRMTRSGIATLCCFKSAIEVPVCASGVRRHSGAAYPHLLGYDCFSELFQVLRAEWCCRNRPKLSATALRCPDLTPVL